MGARRGPSDHGAESGNMRGTHPVAAHPSDIGTQKGNMKGPLFLRREPQKEILHSVLSDRHEHKEVSGSISPMNKSRTPSVDTPFREVLDWGIPPS